MIDALPDEWWPVAVAVATALLDDPAAAAAARGAVGTGARPVARPRRVPRSTTRRSRAAAVECFAAALGPALERLGADDATARRPPSTSTASWPAAAAPPTSCSTTGPGSTRRGRLTWSPRRRSPPRSTSRAGGPSPCSRRSPTPHQRAQVSELMSPLCWDLAHIGHYEELWLRARARRRAADGRAVRRRVRRVQAPAARTADAADPRRRAARASSTPTCATGRSTCSTAIDLDPGDPLLADGFVYGMVVQHEHQHDETLLATLQLMDDFAHPDADGRRRPRPRRRTASGLAADVLDRRRHVRDRHRHRSVGLRQRAPRAHASTLAPFRIDTTPVTNRGVRRSSSTPAATTTRALERSRVGVARRGRPRGAAVLARAAPTARGRDAASAAPRPFRPTSPCSTSAGTRPTPSRAGRARASPPKPSGRSRRAARRSTRANLWRDGPHRFAPAPVGSRPTTSSTWGVHGMLGGVWEWTASDFLGYPGFQAFPYREYSEVFFGPDYKVLRGGSWATHPPRGAHDVPQLGLPDPPPDLRRLPLRARRVIR